MIGELDKLFWLRIALALVGGLSAGLLGFLGPGPQAIRGVFLAIILYIFSYYLAKVFIRVNLPQKDAKKIYTAGLGSFIMLYLFVWTLYNTLVHVL